MQEILNLYYILLMQYWDYHRVSEIENRKEMNLKFWGKNRVPILAASVSEFKTHYYQLLLLIIVLRALLKFSEKDGDFASVCKWGLNPAIPFALSIKFMD